MNEKMKMVVLKQSHHLIWVPRTKAAEIRDTARNNEVVFSGTLSECRAEAERRGLSYGTIAAREIS